MTKPKERLGCAHWLMIAMGVPILVLVVTGQGTYRSASEDRPPSEQEIAGNYLSGAQIEVRKLLRDPSSVEWGKLSVVRNEKGGLVVCGNYSARNGFGGMTGQRGFIWVTGLAVLEEEVGRDTFAQSWNATCAKLPTVYSVP